VAAFKTALGNIAAGGAIALSSSSVKPELGIHIRIAAAWTSLLDQPTWAYPGARWRNVARIA